jgi:hypothetical protein
LLAFGVVLNRNGLRIGYLRADTPIDALTRAADATPPDLIVPAATTPERFDGLAEELSRLARVAPLAIAGAGASRETADAIGARLLTDDPVTAAEQMRGGPVAHRTLRNLDPGRTGSSTRMAGDTGES